MASARQVARWIVDDIISDISGCKGLGDEWDATDGDIQQEIARSWISTVEAYIKKYEPEGAE